MKDEGRTTMKRQHDRLTALQVKNAKDGWYNDGRNLHLRVGNNGASKKWVFRYVRDAKAVEIGLGNTADVTLQQARKLRDQHRAGLAEGLDPREERRKQAAERQGRKTFAEAAAEVIAARQTKIWRANADDGRTSSLDEWTKHLTVDCRAIAKRTVDEIDEDDIEPIVKPYFDRGAEATGRRLLGRIERVFNYAKAKKWRKSDNPAKWEVFEHRLQVQAKGRASRKNSHAALKWPETPAFMAALRALEPSIPAMALEMVVLTACRSGEVRGMRWAELDLDKAVWTIPEERMKRAREHEVPLSADALAIIRRLETVRTGKFVFPGRFNIKPVDHGTVWTLVQQLTGREVGQPVMASPHGFRASFRSWCTARHVPVAVAERCLAHERKGAVEQAYDREEMLKDRREWMEKWAAFLSGADADNVVPLRRA
jgi:integrase